MTLNRRPYSAFHTLEWEHTSYAIETIILTFECANLILIYSDTLSDALNPNKYSKALIIIFAYQSSLRVNSSRIITSSMIMPISLLSLPDLFINGFYIPVNGELYTDKYLNLNPTIHSQIILNKL